MRPLSETLTSVKLLQVNNKKIILDSLCPTLNKLHTLIMFLFVVHTSCFCSLKGGWGVGGGYSKGWGRGENLIWGDFAFYGGLNNPSETMKGSTSKESTSLNVGEKEILTAYHKNEWPAARTRNSKQFCQFTFHKLLTNFIRTKSLSKSSTSSLTISFYLIIFVNIKSLYQKFKSSAGHKVTLLVLSFSSS